MHEAPILVVGGFRIDLSIILTLFVSGAITFIIARLAVRKLSVTNPSKMQNFMEWVVEFVHNTVASTMPLHRAKAFVSLGMTLIMFIFISNLLGLPFAIVTEHTKELSLFGIPIVTEAAIQAAIAKGHHGAEYLWWKSPTADISVTLGFAAIVFVLVHYLGLTRNTKHYLKHYFQPYWFFFPLNLLEAIVKPITLAVRLFANIFAGEILIATILMAGVFGIPFMMAWQGFSIFVGAIQAFLFTILTMVYISQASVHEEGH